MIRHILKAPDPNPQGIAEGDWVRQVGKRGCGRVERVNGNHDALVDWLNGKRAILPCLWLRKVKDRGEAFDTRRGGVE